MTTTLAASHVTNLPDPSQVLSAFARADDRTHIGSTATA